MAIAKNKKIRGVFSFLSYGSSWLLFSIVRQAVFMPFLYSHDKGIFALVFQLFLVNDFLLYAIAASAGDFYTKRSSSKKKRPYLIGSLLGVVFGLTLLLGFFTYLYFFNVLVAILATAVLCLSSMSAVLQKMVFAEGEYHENLYFVVYKSLALISFLVYSWLENVYSVYVLLTLMLILDAVYFRRIAKRTDCYNLMTRINANFISKIFTPLAMFVMTYLFISFITRGEAAALTNIYSSELLIIGVYYSLYLMFLMPLNLLFSAAFLNVLIRNRNINSRSSLTVMLSLLVIYSCLAGVSVTLASKIFYSPNFGVEPWMFALLVFLGGCVIILRPFIIVSFSEPRMLLAFSLSSLGVFLAYFLSGDWIAAVMYGGTIKVVVLFFFYTYRLQSVRISRIE